MINVSRENEKWILCATNLWTAVQVDLFFVAAHKELFGNIIYGFKLEETLFFKMEERQRIFSFHNIMYVRSRAHMYNIYMHAFTERPGSDGDVSDGYRFFW
jgi:hypothetical protein